MGSVMIVAGTRPEAIKLAPVIEWLDKLGVEYLFVWSGQHYDYEMSRIFFEQLGLPEPDYDLDVKSGSHAVQTARVMVSLEEVILREKPSIVVAEGDTNTVVAAALSSVKCFVPFAHVEAGLRSWDRTMPEEINRIVADAVAELHFAPTRLAAINLMFEGIPIRKIHVTGNTVVDVVLKYRNIALKRGEELCGELSIEPKNFILLTVHRQENTDNCSRLSNIVKAVLKIAENYKIVFPIHPRTEKRLREYGLYDKFKHSKNIVLTKPLGYFEFLGLLQNARVVMTDSGGVQEEALTLKVPTVTLRYNTERPETVLVGCNTLVGAEPEKIVNTVIEKANSYESIRKRLERIPNPLGDGRAGERIANILKECVERGISVPTIDSRKDPYIMYLLTRGDSAAENIETVACFNEYGMPEISNNLCKLRIVRGSLSDLRKLVDEYLRKKSGPNR